MKPQLKKAKTIKNLLGLGNKSKNKVNYKNVEELEKDYNEIVEKIRDPLSTTILDLITSKDIKYYIEYNALDYQLFKLAIKNKRELILL